MAKKDEKKETEDCGCDSENKTHQTVADYVDRKTADKKVKK